MKEIMDGNQMKVRIDVDDSLLENEIVIRCSSLDPEIVKMQKAIVGMVTKNKNLELYQGETRYYIPIDQLLFFETDANKICAHTVSDVYTVKYKLYELEELLPSYFARVSKSSILNTRRIYSITKNLSASSVVQFQNSYKQVYVSRYYYKQLKLMLEK